MGKSFGILPAVVADKNGGVWQQGSKQTSNISDAGARIEQHRFETSLAEGIKDTAKERKTAVEVANQKIVPADALEKPSKVLVIAIGRQNEETILFWRLASEFQKFAKISLVRCFSRLLPCNHPFKKTLFDRL